ncbi:MAG: glycoside hydrolase family 3 protein [Alkalispirochaeta sp.]
MQHRRARGRSRHALTAVLLAIIIVDVLAAQTGMVENRSAQPQQPSSALFWQIDGDAVGAHLNEQTPELAAHIERLLSEMTDEERVAQLLMVSWATPEPTPEVMRWIRERNIGGVKVFGWNGENLTTLAEAINEMQRASIDTDNGIPLFTATDQEGGWVRHVKDGTSVTPGNMAIGAGGLPYDALMTGRYIGLELRALGINMNFAPTVDVYRNPDAHVIGPRAFSSDARQTGILGVAYYRGLEETGVIATAKHFPGHGNAGGDSHGMLPVINDDFQTLWEVDMLPFRMLIRDGVPAVLSGHLSFPQVTGDLAPASISPYFKQNVLRDQLSFEGIVITDDLHMGGALEYGAAQGWSFDEVVMRAVEVGNDIVMFSQTPEFDGPIWNTLIDAYRSDATFRRRVDESVRRILRLKLTYLRPDWRVPLQPDVAAIRSVMRTEEAQSFFLDQAGRSVTVVVDDGLPLSPSTAGRVLLVGNDPEFLRSGRAVFPGADTMRFENRGFYSSSQSDRRRFAAAAHRYDTVIFLLSDPASVEILQAGADSAESITVYSILTPIYFAELPWIQRGIAAYGWGRESYESGFSALVGRTPAPGQLPISTRNAP